MATVVINVDQTEVIAALSRLNDSIDSVAENAERQFGGAGDSIGALTSPVEDVTGVIEDLLVAFAALELAGAAAFAAITAKGIALNKEAEITRIALIQIFEGNQGAADAFIATIGELATELGTSRQLLTGFAKGILPDVGSIEGTADLLKNVIILGRDAGAEIDDIRRTLEGALAGQFEGFGDVLNIPPPTIQKIRELSKEIGTAAAITQVLGDRIQDQGLSIEAFADTLDTLESKLSAQAEQFVKILGVAPFEELKEQAADLLGVLEEQGPGIENVAKAFGDLAANVIEFVGTNLTSFIEDIDFEGVEKLVDGFNDAVEAGELLLDVFFGLDDPNLFNSLISGLTTVTEKLKEAATTAAQIVTIEKAERARERAEAEAFRDPLEERLGAIGSGDISTSIKFVPGVVVDFGRALGTAEEKAFAAAEGQKAYDQAIRDSLPAFEKFNESEEENTEKRRERRRVTKDTTEADKAAGEAVLANKNALEELTDAQEKAATAQDEINKKTAEAEEDRQKKLTAIIRREADRRFDDATKAAQRQEDIARKNVDAIEDIFRKNEQAIADASKDLSQDEVDIARKGARERRDIERDAANERVDIERNFRQELKRIQNQFNQDAADAERNNDAQAFIAAVRARDNQIDVATEDRDISVDEAGINAERQRAVLAESLAAEVEDANIANARKLEDLQTRLNQELEAQAIKVEREFEAETIREQRLKEQRDLALQRQLEDFARTEAEKQAKLQESLAAQVALIEAAAAKEIEITAAAEAEKTAIVQAEVARRSAILATRTRQDELPAGGERRGDLLPFQGGGRPPVGKPVKVGEAGPEIFVPDQAGTIIPNNAIFSPPSQAGIMGGSSSVTTNSPTFNLAESMFQDPVGRRNLTNFVLGVLAEGG